MGNKRLILRINKMLSTGKKPNIRESKIFLETHNSFDIGITSIKIVFEEHI